MGGISELRKIFPLAAVQNIPVMPHSFYDGPGLLAAIHATAALGTAAATGSLTSSNGSNPASW